MGRIHAIHAGAALSALSLTACPRPPLDPEPPSAAATRGSESALVIEGTGNPLVVDWQPEHRADLEVAMREGVAVVSYDSKGLRLLKDCRINGTYGFIGVSTKEQVIALESADEVKANLPGSGLSIVAQVGADLGKGSEIAIAIAMVGKRKTTWAKASRTDLAGNCEGATHFVRGATVGAFALQSAARGRARVAAEIFGAGVSTSHRRQKQIQSSDGTLEACRQAAPDASAPPPQCGALLRLELIRLDQRSAAGPLGAEPDGSVCPSGFVFAGGKCTTPKASTPHACKHGDPDCKVQCERGNAASCVTLGQMLLIGKGVAVSDADAVTAFDKACTAKSVEGCFWLGGMYAEGRAVPKDVVKALKLFLPGCESGVAAACSAAGRVYYLGDTVPKNRPLGVKLLRIGCNGGDELACKDVGSLTFTGMGGVPKDDPVAAALFKRACDGGIAEGCTSWGYMHEVGRGFPKNERFADQIYRGICEIHPSACADRGIALMYDLGSRKQDWKRAEVELERACEHRIKSRVTMGNTLFACVVLNVFYGASYPIERKEAREAAEGLAEPCAAGEARDCTFMAVLGLNGRSPNEGKQLLATSCKMGDRWACELAKHSSLK